MLQHQNGNFNNERSSSFTAGAATEINNQHTGNHQGRSGSSSETTNQQHNNNNTPNPNHKIPTSDHNTSGNQSSDFLVGSQANFSSHNHETVLHSQQQHQHQQQQNSTPVHTSDYLNSLQTNQNQNNKVSSADLSLQTLQSLQNITNSVELQYQNLQNSALGFDPTNDSQLRNLSTGSNSQSQSHHGHRF